MYCIEPLSSQSHRIPTASFSVQALGAYHTPKTTDFFHPTHSTSCPSAQAPLRAAALDGIASQGGASCPGRRGTASWASGTRGGRRSVLICGEVGKYCRGSFQKGRLRRRIAHPWSGMAAMRRDARQGGHVCSQNARTRWRS